MPAAALADAYTRWQSSTTVPGLVRAMCTCSERPDFEPTTLQRFDLAQQALRAQRVAAGTDGASHARTSRIPRDRRASPRRRSSWRMRSIRRTPALFIGGAAPHGASTAEGRFTVIPDPARRRSVVLVARSRQTASPASRTAGREVLRRRPRLGVPRHDRSPRRSRHGCVLTGSDGTASLVGRDRRCRCHGRPVRSADGRAEPYRPCDARHPRAIVPDRDGDHHRAQGERARRQARADGRRRGPGRLGSARASPRGIARCDRRAIAAAQSGDQSRRPRAAGAPASCWYLASAQRQQRLARQQMEFVAAVSHELRTPLAVICSAGENLADGVVADGAQVKRYGSLIETEGRRLGDMVERVHGVRRDQLGAPMRPHGRSRRVERDRRRGRRLDADARDRGVTIARAPERHAAAGRRRRARRCGRPCRTSSATRSSTVRGRARWTSRCRASAIESCEIRVADRGLGIDADDLPHIFKPFYRGRRAVDAQVRGTGVGLSVVRHVIDAHRGRFTSTAARAKGRRSSCSCRRSRAPACRASVRPRRLVEAADRGS